MAKRALSKDSILAKATALMKQRGMAAVTIRGLAEELGVTPMAIYKHFESKDDLLCALLENFIANADVLPKTPLSWDRWLHHVGKAMWTALTAEPGWMTLIAASRVRIGGVKVLAACMDVMENAGFSAEQAMEAFFSMVHVSVGSACLQSRLQRMDMARPFDVSDPQLVQRVLRNVKSTEVLREAHRIERSIDLLVAALHTRLPA
jgi:AcrR family transcriptional regulator